MNCFTRRLRPAARWQSNCLHLRATPRPPPVRVFRFEFRFLRKHLLVCLSSRSRTTSTCSFVSILNYSPRAELPPGWAGLNLELLRENSKPNVDAETQIFPRPAGLLHVFFLFLLTFPSNGLRLSSAAATQFTRDARQGYGSVRSLCALFHKKPGDRSNTVGSALTPGSTSRGTGGAGGGGGGGGVHVFMYLRRLSPGK